jgi:hypothetical protein
MCVGSLMSCDGKEGRKRRGGRDLMVGFGRGEWWYWQQFICACSIHCRPTAACRVQRCSVTQWSAYIIPHERRTTDCRFSAASKTLYTASVCDFGMRLGAATLARVFRAWVFDTLVWASLIAIRHCWSRRRIYVTVNTSVITSQPLFATRSIPSHVLSVVPACGDGVRTKVKY